MVADRSTAVREQPAHTGPGTMCMQQHDPCMPHTCVGNCHAHMLLPVLMVTPVDNMNLLNRLLRLPLMQRYP